LCVAAVGRIKLRFKRPRPRDAAVFALLQPEEKKGQWDEGNEEENEPTSTVEISEEELRIHVDGERRERGNSQAVLEDREWDDGNAKDDPSPSGLQEHVAREDRGNQKCERGTYAAAFFGNLNGDSRQVENKSWAAKVRNAGDSEKYRGHIGTAGLEKVDDFRKSRLGNGNHEEKKQEGEASRPKCAPAEKKSKRTEPNENHCEYQEGERICRMEMPQVEARHTEQDQARNRESGA